MLSQNATNKLAVSHIKDEVLAVKKHLNGDIASVATTKYGELNADFFVDCSGFNALLIGKELGVKFVDQSDVLFADHAVTIQVPYADPQQSIASHTLSTAQTAGWIWDIGLQTRRGIGHVYSSAHTSHEQAEQDLRRYIGSEAAQLSSRVIPMKIGYREKFWQNNCVALGLAQGFVEPLEATGLLVFDATAKMLAQQFPMSKQEIPLIAKQFNQRVKHTWQNVIDFVKCHYCLSQRDDSEFWIDNRATESIPESLAERLMQWQFQPPSIYDFTSKLDIFNLDNYLYVLYGMNFNTQADYFSPLLHDEKRAHETFQQIAKYTRQATQHLPKNRELINKILQYGLQKV